jgi:hypothetical protein
MGVQVWLEFIERKGGQVDGSISKECLLMRPPHPNVLNIPFFGTNATFHFLFRNEASEIECMTPFQSTPIIWIAFQNQDVSESFIERMSSFAQGKKIGPIADDRNRFIKEVSVHTSSWLLVDTESSANTELIELAQEAQQQNEFFRCAVVGASKQTDWPVSTIHIPSDSLSTAILDRLRNESHVLRMESSRLRHLRRLQNR